MGFHLCFRRVVLGLAASTGVLLFCPKGEAAERVVLRYGILQRSVLVSELNAFAQTGQLSPVLNSLFTMAHRDPRQVRRVLTQEINVNPTNLERVLNSQIGEALLERVVQVIHSPAGKGSQQELHLAIVNSALPDGKISLIEALQNYPAPEVDVDGDTIASVYRQLSQLAAEHLPKKL